METENMVSTGLMQNLQIHQQQPPNQSLQQNSYVGFENHEMWHPWYGSEATTTKTVCNFPNPQALPASNQPTVLIIAAGHQYNNQEQTNPLTSTLSAMYGYRSANLHHYPMPSYFWQQQQQPQPQVSVSPEVMTTQLELSQPQDLKRPRSPIIIIDPTTNRNVLTGEIYPTLATQLPELPSIPETEQVIEISLQIRNESVLEPQLCNPNHAVAESEDELDTFAFQEMAIAVRGIINDLVPSTFEESLSSIQALNVDTKKQLEEVCKLIFEKALEHPILASTYAKMCRALSSKEVASASNPCETTDFRKLLLTRCQKEFEKEKKKVVQDQDLADLNQRRSLGLITFLCELFKWRIMSAKMMHQCVVRLLSQPEDEESLECLCRLLSTVGKILESPAAQSARSDSPCCSSQEMTMYFNTLELILQENKASNRICFLIQDLIDLRKLWIDEFSNCSYSDLNLRQSSLHVNRWNKSQIKLQTLSGVVDRGLRPGCRSPMGSWRRKSFDHVGDHRNSGSDESGYGSLCSRRSSQNSDLKKT